MEIMKFDWSNITACPPPCKKYVFHQKEIRYAVKIKENDDNHLTLIINYAGNAFITNSKIDSLILCTIDHITVSM